MKNSTLLIGLLGLILTACNFPNTIIPSAEIIEFEIPIDNIEAIDASGIYKITVKIGNEEKLVIRCNENLDEFIRIADIGNTISFEMDNINSSSKLTLEAFLTVKSLNNVDCSGAVRMVLENGDYENIDFELSGASSLRSKDLVAKTISVDVSGASLIEMAKINVDQINLESSGASSVKLTGLANQLIADFSGASHLKSKNLIVQEAANIKGSGASGLKINTNGTLSADLSGACSLVYSGIPTSINKSLSGASSINAE